MKNTTKKSILSKLALVTAIIFTGSYAYGSQSDNNQEKISHLKKTFLAVEHYLSEFVSIKSKTPFNDFVLKIREKLQNLQRNIEESTRSHGSELSKEIDELMDYALQQFNILYNVFKKYNGKPDNQALSFAGEIKREFDTEKIFSMLITKLKALKTKACSTDDKALVEEITALINDIEKKKRVWNAKGNSELFAGIAHRMKC